MIPTIAHIGLISARCSSEPHTAFKEYIKPLDARDSLGCDADLPASPVVLRGLLLQLIIAIGLPSIFYHMVIACGPAVIQYPGVHGASFQDAEE